MHDSAWIELTTWFQLPRIKDVVDSTHVLKSPNDFFASRRSKKGRILFFQVSHYAIFRIKKWIESFERGKRTNRQNLFGIAKSMLFTLALLLVFFSTHTHTMPTLQPPLLPSPPPLSHHPSLPFAHIVPLLTSPLPPRHHYRSSLKEVKYFIKQKTTDSIGTLARRQIRGLCIWR